jgi:hypothetical protein
VQKTTIYCDRCGEEMLGSKDQGQWECRLKGTDIVIRVYFAVSAPQRPGGLDICEGCFVALLESTAGSARRDVEGAANQAFDHLHKDIEDFLFSENQ